MRFRLSIFILVISLLGLKAQECSSVWLTCPQAYIGQQVLYSHTYLEPEELSSAAIVVATTGYFRLCVNGSWVSVPSYPLARAPHRDVGEETTPIATRLDISRYLHPYCNTISVLSCPTTYVETPSFSLRFYGKTTSNRYVSHDADYNWLCCPLNAYETDLSSEYADWSEYCTDTEELNENGIMHWLPVEAEPYCSLADVKVPMSPSYDYISKVIKPNYFTLDDDSRGVTYDFGNGFYGLLRVTFRKTKPGQHVFIAGSEFVCSGKEDEQFILHFPVSMFRQVYISGDCYFRPSNISRVEGLQVGVR